MATKFNQQKFVNRDYKISTICIPGCSTNFVYVYHYKIGFGACFKSVSDAKFWMEGFKPYRNERRRY